jgi:mono/diheme cytochrome c family protein
MVRGRTLLAALALAATCPAAARAETGGAPEGDVERGRYLTHEVAMCVQCHTPRLADGSLDETRLFAGAPMPIDGQRWAFDAPAIRGTGHLSDADLMSLLTTGRRTTGYAPIPPMPPFRLTTEDAAAVIAYLRSLDAAPR